MGNRTLSQSQFEALASTLAEAKQGIIVCGELQDEADEGSDCHTCRKISVSDVSRSFIIS